MHPLLMFINPVRDEMQTAGRDLALALEADLNARNEARITKQAYEDAEAVELAATWMAADGKNAETRKAAVEAHMAIAREPGGKLELLWNIQQMAARQAAETAVALEAAKARFSLTKADAALVAAALTAEPVLA
jgi:hypothetical protein